MNQENYIRLDNGRTIGFAEYGFHDGFPVLFFHGLPGSRFEAGKLHHAAIKTKIRLIGLDRPGMGLSSPQKDRTVLSWADDIQVFTSVLALEKFSLLGHSGGAPYVAAVAYRLPNKVHKAVIVSGIAPLNYPEAKASLNRSQKFMFWMINHCPALINAMMRLSEKSLDNPKRLKRMIKKLPEVDRVIFDSPECYAAMILSLKEAFRQNASFVVEDFKMLSKPWEVILEEIQCPLTVWQGGQDQQAPIQHANIYTKFVPTTNYNWLENEGHLSILHHHGEEILESAV